MNKGNRNFPQLISALSRRAQKKPEVEGNEADWEGIKSLLEEISGRIAALPTPPQTTPETTLEVDTGTAEVIKGLQEGISAIRENLEKSPESLSPIKELLEKIVSAVSSIKFPEFPPFPKFPDIRFPDTQKVTGSVTVDNQVDVSELKTITKKLSEVSQAVARIRFPDFPNIKFPDIKLPETKDVISIKEGYAILSQLEKVEKALASLPEKIKIPKVEFPSTVNVGNFPPQKYPLPVTNININPLRGFPLTTAVTVGTTPTPLPATPADYRRAVVLYNNSGVTIYVGGKEVTVGNGFPVTSGTYSPSFEAGSKFILYGIVQSDTAEMRVLEVTNENIGG